MHESSIFVWKLLCQLSLLSQFCQLKDIFDFNDQTPVALKP